VPTYRLEERRVNPCRLLYVHYLKVDDHIYNSQNEQKQDNRLSKWAYYQGKPADKDFRLITMIQDVCSGKTHLSTTNYRTA